MQAVAFLLMDIGIESSPRPTCRTAFKPHWESTCICLLSFWHHYLDRKVDFNVANATHMHPRCGHINQSYTVNICVLNMFIEAHFGLGVVSVCLIVRHNCRTDDCKCDILHESNITCPNGDSLSKVSFLFVATHLLPPYNPALTWSRLATGRHPHARGALQDTDTRTRQST